MKNNSKIILKDKEYKIINQIGNGGSGDVYKVEESGEFYALKVIRKSNSSSTSRFYKECEFSKNSQHKNIIKYIDYGSFKEEDEEKLYAIMPLYNSSLRSIMKTNISGHEKIKILIQICDAFIYIHNHEEKIIHRDIKPENILVSNNNIVLADFGIAYFNNSVISKKGDRLANFKYRAPEQIEKEMEIGTYTDIYALGLIINEFFTGVVPQGINFEKISNKNILYGYYYQLLH